MKEIKLEDTIKDKKEVIVLGAARSGTSVTAGVLKILGVNMGPDVSPSKSNPRGSYEDREIVTLNKEIYKLAGGDLWNNPPTASQMLDQKNKISSKIKKLVKKKSKNKTIWGWKAPWSNLTVDLFLPYLVNPHFVITFREPLEVARSAVKHVVHTGEAKIDLVRALELTNFYNSEIIKFIRKHQKLPILLISYRDLIDNPEEATKKIAVFLNLKISESQKKDLLDFIIPRMSIGKERRSFKNKPFEYYYILEDKIVNLEKELHRKSDPTEKYRIELNNIYSSKTWKLASFFQKMKHLIYSGSERKKV